MSAMLYFSAHKQREINLNNKFLACLIARAVVGHAVDGERGLRSDVRDVAGHRRGVEAGVATAGERQSCCALSIGFGDGDVHFRSACGQGAHSRETLIGFKYSPQIAGSMIKRWILGRFGSGHQGEHVNMMRSNSWGRSRRGGRWYCIVHRSSRCCTCSDVAEAEEQIGF